MKHTGEYSRTDSYMADDAVQQQCWERGD